MTKFFGQLKPATMSQQAGANKGSISIWEDLGSNADGKNKPAEFTPEEAILAILKREYNYNGPIGEIGAYFDEELGNEEIAWVMREAGALLRMATAASEGTVDIYLGPDRYIAKATRLTPPAYGCSYLFLKDSLEGVFTVKAGRCVDAKERALSLLNSNPLGAYSEMFNTIELAYKAILVAGLPLDNEMAFSNVRQ